MLMSLACDMRHVMSWSLALCGQDLADKQFMRMDWNNRMYYTWCISSTFPPPTVSTVPVSHVLPVFCSPWAEPLAPKVESQGRVCS